MPSTLISVLTVGVGHSYYYFSSQESGTSITKLYLYRILFIRVKSVVDKVFRKRCNGSWISVLTSAAPSKSTILNAQAHMVQLRVLKDVTK